MLCSPFLNFSVLFCCYLAVMRFLCLLLLACVAACNTIGPSERAHHGASMFADLTVQEMKAVRVYLHNIQSLGLNDVASKAIRKNSILLIELHLPKKQRALRVLDLGHAKPPREARVIIQFGNQARPNITEYIVAPLPLPNSHRVKIFKSKRPINFESRPITSVEYYHMDRILQKVSIKMHKLLLEITGGFSYANCSDQCLTFSDVGPRGLGPTERRTWIILQKFVEGFFLHPIGLEMLLNHHDLDPERWTIEKVWYNSMYFDSIEELVDQYELGRVGKLKLSKHVDDDFYSTFMPRGHSNTPIDVHGPKLVEPHGHRYRVDQNFVEYAGWSFAYRVRSSAGLQVFDLRFNGERIAYEIGLQEAIAFYAGDTPAAMQTKYIDAGWAMGTSNFELAPGIDCPETATFVDLYHYFDTDKPVQYKKALCIFEMNTGVPLRRHFDSDYKGGFNFYAGLENSVLVLRTVATVYNYDYIWDFLFYQNGVVEVKVSATGYIHATFFTPNGLNYGTRVQKHVLGNIHTHLIHYKVDLDVSGKLFYAFGTTITNDTYICKILLVLAC